MKIFIEGPRWSGMWTEIIAVSLQQLGHRTGILHHNVKSTGDRLALALRSRRNGMDRASAWTDRYRKQLLQAMSAGGWDLLLSIQGKIDATTLQLLRQHSPGLQVIFWWGDILGPAALARIRAASEFAERILVSYAGSHARLTQLYGDRVVYFPFGIAPGFHAIAPPGASERRRYGAAVSFVGTCYPERCELLRYLNRHLEAPVAVWGRGWRHCRGVRGRGALTLRESLLVHGASQISLNLHHAGTENGFNMKYYEIPAAGGFQLCDWQTALETSAHGRHTVACRSPAEFAEKIAYFLAHPEERRELARAARETVLETAAYAPRLAALLQDLA